MPLGVGGPSAGQCWECLGRPPDWVCNECKKPMPCAHLPHTPALSKEVAAARARLMRVIDAYKDGQCEWATVEAALAAHETAQWKARTEWGFAKGRSN